MPNLSIFILVLKRPWIQEGLLGPYSLGAPEGVSVSLELDFQHLCVACHSKAKRHSLETCSFSIWQNNIFYKMNYKFVEYHQYRFFSPKIYDLFKMRMDIDRFVNLFSYKTGKLYTALCKTESIRVYHTLSIFLSKAHRSWFPYREGSASPLTAGWAPTVPAHSGLLSCQNHWGSFYNYVDMILYFCDHLSTSMASF